MPKILLPSGGRAGPNKMRNETAFKASLANGDEVYTMLNNVYFAVTLNGAGDLAYASLPRPPEGLNNL